MTTERLLLDTCAVIWSATGARLDASARLAIEVAAGQAKGVVISPITAWELGTLAARGRLPTAQKPADLLAEVLALPGLELGALTPAILIDSSFLPGDFHGDPADRIIVATAREHYLTVVTRDRAILAYAKKGYVRALAC